MLLVFPNKPPVWLEELFPNNPPWLLLLLLNKPPWLLLLFPNNEVPWLVLEVPNILVLLVEFPNKPPWVLLLPKIPPVALLLLLKLKLIPVFAPKILLLFALFELPNIFPLEVPKLLLFWLEVLLEVFIILNLTTFPVWAFS